MVALNGLGKFCPNEKFSINKFCSTDRVWFTLMLKDSSIWILLDFAKEEYSRCDTKGCDTYKMTVDVGGIYINIFSTGFKSKVSADRKEFMEYVSLRTTSYLSYGSCEKL